MDLASRRIVGWSMSERIKVGGFFQENVMPVAMITAEPTGFMSTLRTIPAAVQMVPWSVSVPDACVAAVPEFGKWI